MSDFFLWLGIVAAWLALAVMRQERKILNAIIETKEAEIQRLHGSVMETIAVLQATAEKRR